MLSLLRLINKALTRVKDVADEVNMRKKNYESKQNMMKAVSSIEGINVSVMDSDVIADGCSQTIKKGKDGGKCLGIIPFS